MLFKDLKLLFVELLNCLDVESKEVAELRIDLKLSFTNVVDRLIVPHMCINLNYS